jgi:uncharacterized protein YlxW (UPF0749 family)
MPRPTIDEDVLERLEAEVENRTKVPAEHLTTTQRLAFLLDELGEAEERAGHLADRVDTLEDQLEAAREEAERNDRDRDRVDATEGIDGLNLGTGHGTGRGPNTRGP